MEIDKLVQDNERIQEFLTASASLHSRLCPRQVLGVRVGLAGAQFFGLPTPCPVRSVLVILEVNGCFADGVAVVTGASVGKRTLRVEDLGRTAATFVDAQDHTAVRISVHPEARTRALTYVTEAKNRYSAQLQAYQVMPDEALLVKQMVEVEDGCLEVFERPARRVQCARCGEEILHQRFIVKEGLTLCRACVGDRYYRLLNEI